MMMRRFVGVVFLVLVFLALAAPAVMAQDGPTALPDGVIALTVGELIGIGSGLLALMVALVAVVRNWASGDVRSLAGLDRGVSAELKQLHNDREFVGSVEKIVDSQNRQWREMMKDYGELVLRAAQWIPGESVEAGAELFSEFTDGVPVSEKLAELERRAADLEALRTVSPDELTANAAT